MKKPITVKQFVINNLRKASWKWGPKNACKKAAKIARNQYTCKRCKNVFGNKDVKVDHIKPVVSPEEGWIDYNTYIERLYCDESGFQLLCRDCHELKTDAENEVRRHLRNKERKKNA